MWPSSGANNLVGSITGSLELYFGDEFEFSIASTTPGQGRRQGRRVAHLGVHDVPETRARWQLT